MEVNAKLIKTSRTSNNWTQQHLADACDLNIRTIQRVERYGNASSETVSALAAVLELPTEEIIKAVKPINEEMRKPSSAWVERIVLTMSSAAIGYAISYFTGS